jgi:nucleoside-diphosphate-sugar epimerase
VKVFLTGGTGAVGRPALRGLVAAGHEVTAVARTPAKQAEVESAGAAAGVAVDLFDPAAVAAAVAGHEAVLNLATHVPPPTRAARASAWATHDRLRREASVHLVDGALATGAARFVQESIVFSYPDSGDRWIDAETAAPVPARVTDAALAAEAQVARFTAGGGTGVALRFGLFYGRGTAYTDAMLRWARWGLVYSPGDAGGYGSSIHVDDAAAAAVAALAAPAGIYDVTDDQPLTHREQATVLAAAAGRSRFLRAPGRLARFAGPGGEVGMRSQRVSNRRFREATGWAPRWPSMAEGLAAPPR